MDRSQEIRFNRYRNFFTRHLKKYIEERFYTLQSDPNIFSIIEDISFHDCERWKSGLIDYLSPREALALGIHLGMGEDRPWLLDKYFNQVMEYLDWCLNHSQCKQTQTLAHLALGVILFEKGVNSPKEFQRKYIQLSRYYLEESLEGEKSKETHEVLFMYLTLVEVCLDDLPKALKYLSKASKVSESPIPIWKMLASIYKNLGMQKVSSFYLGKIKTNEYSLAA